MKKILAILLAVVMMFSLVACGGDKDNQNDDGGKTFPSQSETGENSNNNNENDDNNDNSGSTEQTKPEENELIVTDKFMIPDTDAEAEGVIEIASRNPDNVAIHFVQAVAMNYYQSAVDAFQVSSVNFITASDIKYSVPRSDYKTLANHSGKEVYLSVDPEKSERSDSTAKTYVELKSDDTVLETYIVSMKMNADNVWYINDLDFYMENYYLTVPGGVDLYVDDVEVPESMYVSQTGHSDLKALYKIDAIGYSTKIFKIKCESFDEDIEVSPEYSPKDDAKQLAYHLNEEELDAALKATQNIWNSMYNDYVTGATAEDLKKYFSKDSVESYPTDVIGYFEQIRKGSSGFKDIDHHISIIEKRSDESGCFYLSDTVIALNIKYQIDWVWDFSMGGPEYSRHMSHILLTIEDGEYKIYQISDPKFFTNNFGQDW